MRGKPVTFFIIDDDDVDYQAIERALSDIKIINPVARAKDGVEALEMLRGENGHNALEGPMMILLDLNMPKMGGLEFLKNINEDKALKEIGSFHLDT